MKSEKKVGKSLQERKKNAVIKVLRTGSKGVGGGCEEKRERTGGIHASEKVRMNLKETENTTPCICMYPSGEL